MSADAPGVSDALPTGKITPFQRELSLPLGGRQNRATFIVPGGMRLVIEYASASAHIPFGQRLLVGIETSANGARATHFLVPAWPDVAQFAGTDGDFYRIRQWLRAYADGGTEVNVIVKRTGNWGAGSATITVSRHLISSR